jgi:hypothetical protein
MYFIFITEFTNGLFAISTTLHNASRPYLSRGLKYATNLLRFIKSQRLVLFELMLNWPRNVDVGSVVKILVMNYMFNNIIFSHTLITNIYIHKQINYVFCLQNQNLSHHDFHCSINNFQTHSLLPHMIQPHFMLLCIHANSLL